MLEYVIIATKFVSGRFSIAKYILSARLISHWIESLEKLQNFFKECDSGNRLCHMWTFFLAVFIVNSWNFYRLDYSSVWFLKISAADISILLSWLKKITSIKVYLLAYIWLIFMALLTLCYKSYKLDFTKNIALCQLKTLELIICNVKPKVYYPISNKKVSYIFIDSCDWHNKSSVAE